MKKDIKAAPNLRCPDLFDPSNYTIFASFFLNFTPRHKTLNSP